MVAELIQKKNATLLDLLTIEEEDSDYENRFNVDLLASRLIETTEWLMNYDEAKGCPSAILELVLERPQRCGQLLLVIL
jgi:hypothetical protein